MLEDEDVLDIHVRTPMLLEWRDETTAAFNSRL